MEGVGVDAIIRWLVAPPESEQIGSHDAARDRGVWGFSVPKQDGDHSAIQIRPGWLTVDAEEGFSHTSACAEFFVYVRHPQVPIL